MQDLNDLVLYAAVVRHNGFTAAASALGVPKSKISKRVAHLEDELGVRLIERSTRKLRVTEIGQSFYERCQEVLGGVEAATAVIAAARTEPAGIVRVAMPIGFAPAMSVLLPIFLKRYPRVRLSVVPMNRPVDLIEEQFDVALRVREGYSGDQAIVVRKFGETRSYLAASPEFLERYGQPTLETLSLLPTLAMHESSMRQQWTLVNAQGEIQEIPHQPVLACSDFGVLERAAIEGIGVALLPDAISERGFRTGLLQQVLPEWTSVQSTIHAAFPSRTGMLPAVRAFIDFLAEHLAVSMARCREVEPPRKLDCPKAKEAADPVVTDARHTPLPA